MALQIPYTMEKMPMLATATTTTRRKRFLILAAVLSTISILFVFAHSPEPHDAFPDFFWHSYHHSSHFDFDDSEVPYLRDVRQPGLLVPSPGREVDVADGFANFTRHPWCTMSSLELHDPFAPLCDEKHSLMAALSGGGRAGTDMPYQPRGCDMRWFSTAELCEILSRFSFIHIVGDSMMRNLAVAMHTLLREDLYDGPWLQWTKPKDGLDCSCAGPFNDGSCIFNAAWSSKEVYGHDPGSMACPRNNSALVEYQPQTAYPRGRAIKDLTIQLPTVKPAKPHVFVIGHGIWNSLNETATELFLDEVETGINQTMPWLTEPGAVNPRLFITPSASGSNKPVRYQESQGNVALRRFETNMGPIVRVRGYDHLGTFNLTLQNTTPDGTHAGMRSNLVKAMMVFNWLNMYDISGYLTEGKQQDISDDVQQLS